MTLYGIVFCRKFEESDYISWSYIKFQLKIGMSAHNTAKFSIILLINFQHMFPFLIERVIGV